MKGCLRGWRPGGQLVQTPQMQRESVWMTRFFRRSAAAVEWVRLVVWRAERVSEKDAGQREAWRREGKGRGRESEMGEAVAVAVAAVVVGKEAW